MVITKPLSNFLFFLDDNMIFVYYNCYVSKRTSCLKILYIKIDNWTFNVGLYWLLVLCTFIYTLIFFVIKIHMTPLDGVPIHSVNTKVIWLWSIAWPQELRMVFSFLRLLFIQFSSLFSVSDTQVGQEVNKERSVQILAQLIEDKPVTQLALSDKGLNLGNPPWLSEISVHPHVEQFISDPGWFHLNQPVDQSQGCNDAQHTHPPPENKEDLNREIEIIVRLVKFYSGKKSPPSKKSYIW